MEESGIPLSFARTDTALMVTGIRGGRGLCQRLAEMGLTPGSLITIKNGCHPGPLFVDIRGSKLGIGFGTAQKIFVKEVKDEQETYHGSPCGESQLGENNRV